MTPRELPLALPLAAVLCAATLAPLPAAESARDTLQALVRRIGGTPTNVRSVLNDYSRIESSRRFDVFGRHEIHEGLLKELRTIKDPEMVEVAKSILASTAKTQLPSQVLILKTVIGDGFPAPREDRISILRDSVRHKDRWRLVWGARLLGDSRWPEGVDALIDLLAEAESKDPEGSAAAVLSQELYRLLGAAGRGTAAGIRKSWESLGKKIPDAPEYSASSAGETTFVFFGDRISPWSIFAIDMSSSMREQTSLREGSSGGTAVGKGERSGPRMPKVEIVRKELLRALDGLPPSCNFNILAYSNTFAPWKASGQRISLHRAGTEAVRSAKGFAERLETGVGTNIHDTLAAALDVAEVETVYLLSDGVPSRGGSPAEIEKRAAAMNYLSGVRIVTYGFAPEAGGGSYDEEFMRRLAKQNWGWYRRLN